MDSSNLEWSRRDDPDPDQEPRDRTSATFKQSVDFELERRWKELVAKGDVDTQFLKDATAGIAKSEEKGAKAGVSRSRSTE